MLKRGFYYRLLVFMLLFIILASITALAVSQEYSLSDVLTGKVSFTDWLTGRQTLPSTAQTLASAATGAPSCYSRGSSCPWSPENLRDSFCAYNCGETGDVNSECYDPACPPRCWRQVQGCYKTNRNDFERNIGDNFCAYNCGETSTTNSGCYEPACVAPEFRLRSDFQDTNLIAAVREQNPQLCNTVQGGKNILCKTAVAAKRANPDICDSISDTNARRLCEDNAKAVSCGDGIAQEWEECDGFDLKGQTCETYFQYRGYGGSLLCTSECRIEPRCGTERAGTEGVNIIQEMQSDLRPTNVEKIFSGRLSYNLLDFSSVGGERLGAGTYFTDVYKIHYDAPLQELNNLIGEVTLRWATVDPAISIRQENRVPLFNSLLTYGTPPAIDREGMIELCQFANLPSIIRDSSGPAGGDRSTCFAYLDEEGIHLLAYAYHIKTDTSGRNVNKWFHGRCLNVNDCEYRFSYNVYGEATT